MGGVRGSGKGGGEEVRQGEGEEVGQGGEGRG